MVEPEAKWQASFYLDQETPWNKDRGTNGMWEPTLKTTSLRSELMCHG